MFWLFLLLKIVLYIVGALILFLALILMLPFSYESDVVMLNGLKANFRLGWPWRFINVAGNYDEETLNLSIYLANKRIMKIKNNEIQKNDAQEEAVKPKRIKKKPESKGPKRSFKDFIDKEFITEILHYLKRLYDITKPKQLKLSGTYGFEDPSVTGMLCGVLATFNGALPQKGINLYPCFVEEIFEFDFKIAGQIQIGSAVFQTLRTVLKKSVRSKIFHKRK